MTAALAALALQFGDYRDHGYTVAKFGNKGWTLADPEGGLLLIGNEGQVSSRKGSAELEAYRRIAEEVTGR